MSDLAGARFIGCNFSGERGLSLKNCLIDGIQVLSSTGRFILDGTKGAILLSKCAFDAISAVEAELSGTLSEVRLPASLQELFGSSLRYLTTFNIHFDNAVQTGRQRQSFRSKVRDGMTL